MSPRRLPDADLQYQELEAALEWRPAMDKSLRRISAASFFKFCQKLMNDRRQRPADSEGRQPVTVQVGLVTVLSRRPAALPCCSAVTVASMSVNE